MADKRLTLLKKANKLFRQGKNDSALKEYKKVLAIKPDDMEVRRIIGDIELRLKNTKGAIEQFEWMADHYLNEGFFTKAIAMYKRITRLDPSYEKASFRLAELYTRQGLIIEAKQIYLEMADNFKRNNNQKRSLDMYKKILEFDRKNIKMRLILAENYFRENLENEAINEYLIASDILLSKKDFSKVEEILLPIIKKTKNIKLTEKIIFAFAAEGKDEKAIDLLKDFGSELFKNVNLLKLLGELYFKKSMIDDAEKMFKKVTEIDPNETEILLKLGKVYLQRGEYDKTFDLFLPIIDNKLKEGKVEEATGLLRIIIASNNFYLPALNKLASVFRAQGDKHSLIPLNESLIPIYEEKNMKEELKEVLEELIRISDSPFNYEEKLASLGRKKKEINGLEDSFEINRREREEEQIANILRTSDDMIKHGDVENAIASLNKARMEFPQNIDIKKKLYTLYKERNEPVPAVSVGKELLELYRQNNNTKKYEELLDDLSIVAPEDEKVLELSGEEKTNIDIDFEKSDIVDQLNDIENTGMKEIDLSPKTMPEQDVIVLSDKDSVIVDKKSVDPNFKSISGYLSEIDFYINDGYYEDAEKLTEELLSKFPSNDEVNKRVEKLKRLKKEKIEKVESGLGEIEIELDTGDMEIPSGELEVESNFHVHKTRGDSATFMENPDYQKEISDDLIVSEGPEEPPKGDELELTDPFTPVSGPETKLDPKESSKSDSISGFNFEDIISGDLNIDDIVLPDDSKPKLELDNLPLPEEKIPEKTEFSEISDMKYEIEMDDDEKVEDIRIDSVDKELVTTSPDTHGKKVEDKMGISSSNILISLDNAFEEEEVSKGEKTDSPFEEIDKFDLLLENEEEQLKSEVVFPETIAFLEIEKNIEPEQEAFKFWISELKKQRTSTVEKNMMEIFDEFKKGVDEKIGNEDFETRYNLGIAYKEMGLIEEAIHEFMISSKNDQKFFDSAGLLGMCFREKGMLDDAAEWFNKALNFKGRKKSEYMAVKYELISTYKVKEDYKRCLKLSEELFEEDPGFRDIKDLKQFFQSKVNQ